ncbi:MAG TPA: MCD, Malonyl-CoA decarboxylase MCD, partial [Halomonas sp.]|nr:MCD, Malonyl-CoA decarboxylase MCD [Halomonas sp.]
MNMSFLQELFNSITQRDALLRRRRTGSESPHSAGLVDACHTLLESDGEASSIALASRALDMYESLPDDERQRFFERLDDEFAADPEAIDAAYAAYREARDNATLEALFE